MNYVDSLNLFGVEAKEIPCIKFSGAPTSSTVGAVGLFGMNILNGDVYKCIAADNGVYTWAIVGVKPEDIPSGLPEVTVNDAGKFLRVSSSGTWAAEVIPNAEGVSF